MTPALLVESWYCPRGVQVAKAFFPLSQEYRVGAWANGEAISTTAPLDREGAQTWYDIYVDIMAHGSTGWNAVLGRLTRHPEPPSGGWRGSAAEQATLEFPLASRQWVERLIQLRSFHEY